MTDPNEPDLTAAEFALGLLGEEERAAAMRRVLHDHAFARDVERWSAHFATLFVELPDVEAPNFVAQFETSTVGAAYRSIWVWRSVSAVAMAIAACLLLVVITRAPPANPPSRVAVAPQPLVAALAYTDGKPATPVLYDVTARELRIAGLVVSVDGKSAELWAIGGDGVPHALGLLTAGGTTRIVVPTAATLGLAPGTTLAISIEPPGGSPRDVPTGPVVATGALLKT